jgi:transposase InsO family protein
MQVIMNDMRFTDVTQLKTFLQGSQKLALRITKVSEKYQHIRDTVKRLHYRQLTRKDKHIVIMYLRKITGYKKTQLTMLIQKAQIKDLVKKEYIRAATYHTYTPCDIKLLEKTDEYHLRLNRFATAEILRREYVLFHHRDYQLLSHISPSHIDNLRKTNTYKTTWVNGTKSVVVAIGKTQKPENPNNAPGSLRIDTCHQRDVYHIHAIDEVTQWEIIICVPQISEAYLKPALELLLELFPFVVFNFHSDRGSEFINKVVAEILNKLLINQTKSRSRHCNDNALIESKNGSILRKNMGYFHINKGLVGEVNIFYQDYFIPYLNYHRPCGFVTTIKQDEKGRERKIYGQYTTPYEKLKEVSKEQNKNFLKPGLTFDQLDTFAYSQSDNKFAKIMREKQNKLFKKNELLEHTLSVG